MDRRPDLPAIDPDRPIRGDSDILSHVNAVFKRHRPLGALQNFPRASRVLVPQEEPLKSTGSIASVAGRKLPKTVANRGAGRLLAVASGQEKDSVVETRTTPAEDSLLNPPSVTGSVTDDRNNNLDHLGMEQGDAELLLDQKKASLACPLSSVNFKKDQSSSAENSGLTFQSVDERMTIDTRMDDITSYLRSLALTEGEDQFANQVPLNYQDLNQQGLPSMEIYNTSGAHIMEKIDDLRRSQQTVDSMTRSTFVGSSCVTTMSVRSGPMYQCTHAPLAGHTGASTQMSSVVEKSFGVSAQTLPEGQEVIVKESDGSQHQQQSLHMGDGIRENVVCSNASHLQSQATSSNISTSNMEPSQSSKVEKAPRKKKYDPDVFFKVNGKLYQKLGKIGSGGSSEVHKVITSDCVIHALKKIKLKGRDYPTAYGFCQEIEYLNKLKGKTNIIQLIDYEVTDKTLLQEGMNSSMTIKDGRIKDDQYIYMVLEYGEIDLACMLSQKWRDVEGTSSKIDENWLRFYWQQMLEAVNTIHEERIVHSDLKPANFLLVKGSLKLIDFGIAKAILSDTTNIERDTQVGTLNYMSPEAFMWNEQDSSGNTIKLGRPSDIWSLGCILYQMVYGKTPFAGYTTFWSKFKVITDKNHEINYEPTTNPLLVDLMKRCLAWERNERWRIPQLLQHPFIAPAAIPGAMPLPVEVNFLLEKIPLYWNDSEVSRLCKELHTVVDNLERAGKE